MQDKKDTVTILDVAKIAGVSPSTVTHALNGKRPVKEDTREKVLAAIDRLGYIPSWNASRMKGHSSGIIGCLATDITKQFTNQIIRGIEEGLIGGQETLLIVSLVEFGDDYEAAYKFLMSHEIDGLLIVHHIPTASFETITSRIPVVSLNMNLDGHISIYGDGFGGGYRAADHLYSSGMRAPAIICGPSGRPSSENRLSGYMTRVRELGLEMPEKFYYGEYDFSHGYEACQDLIGNGKKFDGIFAEDDYIAAGAITALNEHGIRVPEDVLVVGFNDCDFTSFWKPTITTFRPPYQEMGLIGLSLLRSLIANKTVNRKKFAIDNKLIPRHSTLR